MGMKEIYFFIKLNKLPFEITVQLIRLYTLLSVWIKDFYAYIWCVHMYKIQGSLLDKNSDFRTIEHWIIEQIAWTGKHWVIKGIKNV